jgi:sucrose-6-phosphate hydrolase SacC (GH32 family)
MNDPNGLILYKGEYHLFFQHNPDDTVWGPMNWGHFVSDDLMHWEELDIALCPDRHGTIFSGCVVYDSGNTSGVVPGGGLVAVYTYHKEDADFGQQQTQGLAFSLDRGRVWTPFAGNPIIKAEDKAGARDFRDPRVFRYMDYWALVLAAGDHLCFYRSDNLVDWRPSGIFDFPFPGCVMECPDLFPLRESESGEDAWILIISLSTGAPAGGSGTVYFVGAFNGSAFSPISGPRWLDWGPDNYAGSTWDTGTERIFIGWMNNWRYARDIPAAAGRSRGSMSVPRKLSLLNSRGSGWVLCQSPVIPEGGQSEGMRAIGPLAVGQARSLGTVPCHSIQKIRIERKDEGPIEASLRWTYECGAALWVLVRGSGGELIIDRSDCGAVDFNSSFVGRISVPLARRTNVFEATLLFDTTSLELFAEDGASVASVLIFPERTDADMALDIVAGDDGTTVSVSWRRVF